MSDADALAAVAERGVRQAVAAGADDAEVYLWSAAYHHAKLGGRLASVARTDVTGLSVRVLVDGRLAFAVTSGAGDDDLDWAIRRAVDSARLLPRAGKLARFADPSPRPEGRTFLHPKVQDPDGSRLVGLVETLDASVEGAPSVDYAEATVAAHAGRFVVANSRGVLATDANAYESLTFEVRSRGRGHKYTKAGLYGRRPLDEDHDVEAFARGTVELAAGAVDPRPLDRPATQAILDAVAAKEVLHRVLPAFNGASAAQGRSRLSGRLGERVADERLTIRDRPSDGLGCRNQRVDDEGVPTRDLTLLERGVVRAFRVDWRTSLETGQAPTGHGLRKIDHRYESMPAPGSVNVEVEPGDWSLEEMVASAERAVLVRGGVLGSFTMNAFTGDFSFVVPMAHLVEGGKVRHALESCTAAGNVFDCLDRVRAIGRDPHRLVAGTSVPMWVEGVTFAT